MRSLQKLTLVLACAGRAVAQTYHMTFYSTKDCTGISSSLTASSGQCLYTDAFSIGTYTNLRLDFTSCDFATSPVIATTFEGPNGVCTGTGTPAGISNYATFLNGNCGEVLADVTYMTATCSAAAPCFGRTSTDATLASGETVSMTSLKAGDYVKDGEGSSTRVLVNQHAKAAHLSSSLLDIEHADGNLSLTADHVLSVDGAFVAAREAIVGTKLGESQVTHVSHSNGGIINPLTTSGKIVANGVVASTYPEWIAAYVLRSTFLPTVTLSNLISFTFPALTQEYYDAHLERFFQSASPALVKLKTALPDPCVAFVIVVADLTVAAGFLAFSLASFQAALALLVVAGLTASRK